MAAGGRRRFDLARVARSTAFAMPSKDEQAAARWPSKFWTNVAITGVGPAVAAIFTNPADVAKTRLNMDRELQSSGSKPRYAGTLDCLRRIWTTEGMNGVQRGLSFALVREVSKGLFRYGLHEPIMQQMHTQPTPAPLSTKLLAGFASGAIAALICNPFDLIKTRLQLEPTHAQGLGAGSGPVAVLREAIQREGARSLWAGTQVSMVRSMLGTAAIMGVNLQLQEWMTHTLRVRTNVATDVFCSFFAATACVAVINPVDVPALPRSRTVPAPLASGPGSRAGCSSAEIWSDLWPALLRLDCTLGRWSCLA